MKWTLKNIKGEKDLISKTLNIDPIIANVLINRGYKNIKDINKYLVSDEKELYSPESLKDSDIATEILIEKINEEKSIRIVGDYDVDGIMSTYILYNSLLNLNAKVDFVIPHRINDGYGINIELVKKAKEDNIDTIITCDNGISAINEINYGKEIGLNIIVTDHHDIPYIIKENKKEYIKSNADAIVNPKQIDCKYPFDSICGATVAWKLMQVLYNKLKGKEEFKKIDLKQADNMIEFASIATVCDVMELIDENRIIVKTGLSMLKKTKNLGLIELMKENKISSENLKSYHLGFIIGPCLNSTGRLESAKMGLDLLNTKDPNLAKIKAKELVELNKSRKELTLNGTKNAIELIDGIKVNEYDYSKDKVLVVYIPNTHESIAGIIAGRIREKYNKPVFIITDASEGLKGSGRSIDAYNMYEEMVKIKDVFLKFGGHHMAAGLSIEKDKFKEFRKRINENCKLTDEDLEPSLRLDAQMDFASINESFINQLNLLEPFGRSNEKPIFGLRNVQILSVKLIGKNKNVLKLVLKDHRNLKFNGIFFGEIDKFINTLTQKYDIISKDRIFQMSLDNIFVDIAYYPSINEYNGNRYLQIIISEFK